MAPREVVDLLSSGDEKAAAPPGSILHKRPIDADFKSLHDDFDSPFPCSSLNTEKDSKRRKLSQGLSSGEDTYALPSLSRAAQRPPHTKVAVNVNVQATQGWTTLEDDDPIFFTSSLGARKSTKRAKTNGYGGSCSDETDSDDSLPDKVVLASSRIKASALSTRTAAILETLSQHPPRLKTNTARKTFAGDGLPVSHGALQKTNSNCGPSGSEGETGRLSRASKASRKAILTTEEKEILATEKEKQKAAKLREKESARIVSKELKAKEKEVDKERRRLLKEEKAREKQEAAARAEVNKLKLDKKDSTPEMIVDLPASIAGQEVDIQIKEFFKQLGIDSALYQSLIPNVIKWRRKTRARWDEEKGHYEPLDRMEIHDEKHVLCLMSAKEFVDLAIPHEGSEDVETHVTRLKSAHGGCTPIYLIEGLTQFMAKSKNAVNREYQARVNSLVPENAVSSSSQQSSKKTKKMTVEIVDEDVIEDALLRLQFLNGCLVHHTPICKDTAEWVAIFTQYISTIPHKLQRMNLETTFCMDGNQIKAGEDKDDTFVKMLQEVVRVTPAIAHGIALEYPSVVSLVKAFWKHGPDLLGNLQKSANKNGVASDRRIGPAISRRLYKVFTELDPSSADV